MNSKKNTEAYQAWLGTKELSIDFLASKGSEIPEELLKAEPDLVAAPEPAVPEELTIAIELIQDGFLQRLSATQQKVFQLSIVEGMKDSAVIKTLDIDKAAFKHHIKMIGVLFRRAMKKQLV